MKCPHEGATLKPLQAHDIEVDICVYCGGIWLDKKDFEKSSEYFSYGGAYNEIAYTKVDNKMFEEGLVRRQTQKKCPYDRIEMEEFVYGANSGVKIDKCPQCEGFWCDSGELLRIQKFLMPSPQVDLLGKLFIDEMNSKEKQKKEIVGHMTNLVFAVQSPLFLVFLIVKFLTNSWIKNSEREAK